MIYALWVLLEREVVGLLRTRELYFFGLLPAFCGLPVILLIGTIAASLQTGIALPPTDPEGITLETPANALRKRASDPETFAVTSWSLDEQGTLEAVVQATTEDDVESAERTLRRMMADVIKRRVIDAGGDGTWDRIPIDWIDPPNEKQQPLLVFVIALLGAQLGLYLLPGRTVAERLAGVFESLVVTDTPLFVYLGVRALVGAVLTLTLLGLPLLMVLLVLPPENRDFSVPLLPVLELFSVLLFTTSALVSVGSVVKSSANALNGGALVIFLLIFAPAAGFSGLDMLPIAGMGHHGSTPAVLVRIAATFALAAVPLGLASLWLRGHRALPAGHGDV